MTTTSGVLSLRAKGTVTSFRIEHLAPQTSTHSARAVRFTREQALDQLAGRTIWCDVETPGMARPRALAMPADQPLRELATRLDAILSGAFGDVRLSPAERDLCAQAADTVTPGIARDDIVLLHDALSALVATAVRERGAHTIWLMQAPVRRAPSLPPDFASAVDAYVVAWREAVAAMMPSAGAVTVLSGPDAELDWNGVLADVVEADRHEHVGGRLHPRPAVAAR